LLITAEIGVASIKAQLKVNQPMRVVFDERGEVEVVALPAVELLRLEFKRYTLTPQIATDPSHMAGAVEVVLLQELPELWLFDEERGDLN
jgi:hypothetical protein